MHPDDKRQFIGAAVFLSPPLGWLFAVRYTEMPLAKPAIKSLWRLLQETPSKPVLWISPLAAFATVILLVLFFNRIGKGDFSGANFRKHLRGTKLANVDRLKSLTRRKKFEQISIAGVPMPPEVENLHLLVAGSTGGGKSVLIREAVYSALLRGDRMIIADPNGDMLAKFGRKGDKVLNPYDARTEGWSFFNEIRNDYDFKRYALSIIPRGQSSEEEEWRSYSRLLFQETARKLALMGSPSVEELFKWTTIADPKDLKAFLSGTAAESMFVGADKALASARFVLSQHLPEHLTMPKGGFSLRTWLEDPKGGNLFITWREDMAPALRPLISAWVDVLCTSILSLPDDNNRRIWMVLDELASMEKLASLMDALTKGRKAGLRIMAGLQTVAQLDRIFGQDEAQALRASFRSLVVLGGARSDEATCEEMSKSLGEHEVERDHYSRNSNPKGTTRGRSIQYTRERVIMASEIASLPELTGYVAFSGDYPIARVKLKPIQFQNRLPSFKERELKRA